MNLWFQVTFSQEKLKHVPVQGRKPKLVDNDNDTDRNQEH